MQKFIRRAVISKYTPIIIHAVSALLVIISTFYLFSNRYYFRIIPIPPSALEWLDTTFPGKISSTFVLKSNPEMPNFNLPNGVGVNNALKFVRNFSPLALTTGRVDYSNITFDNWLDQLSSKAGYCTDFSLLLAMIAIQNDIPVREWILWSSKHWEGGNAHTIVEIFNPKSQKWQLLDGQHAIKISAADGTPTTMANILLNYYPNNMDKIKYVMEPSFSEQNSWFQNASRAGIENGVQSAVLNFKLGSWFAATPKSELVIGLAMLTGNSSHDTRIYITKFIALFITIVTVVYLVIGLKFLKFK
jgi:hypothetical protein